MMDIIKLFLSIFAMTIAGYSVLSIVLGKDSRSYSLAEKAALSYGLGMGCIAFEFLLFAILGLSFDLWLILTPWVFLLPFALWRGRKGLKLPKPVISPGFFSRENTFFTVLLLIIVLQVSSVFLRALSTPLESYDGIINFGIKSKIFFMSNGISMDLSTFEGIGKGHMDYPLLIPLAETWVYKFLGYNNDCLVKILFPLVLVSFAVVFYSSLKRLFNAKYAIFFTFLLCTVPQIVNFAMVGYADLTLAFMVTTAFIFLFRYFREGKKHLLVLSAIFSGIGLLTKNEGISFFVSSVAIIVLFVLREKGGLKQTGRIFTCYFLPLAVLVFPWMYFKSALSLGNTDIDFSQLTLARLAENAGYIPFILNKFQQEVFGPKKWNILWIMVLGFTLLKSKKIKGFRLSETGLFLLFNVLIYFTSYMILTGKDLYFHVNTSLPRLMIHFSGISLFFLAFLVRRDERYVFIDRDGVINKDPGGWTEYSYVTRREDFHLLSGALEALEKLAEAGYKGVIISNQQGVGKGYFTEKDLEAVTDEMLQKIKKAGGDIEGVYYCTHAKEEDCPCRKPKTGLFEKAEKELGIDPKRKFYIGDTERDMDAGRAAGLRTILVLSGKSSRDDAKSWHAKPDFICDNFLEAANLVIKGL
ncbi:MAG: HAD-IIIA family hydrolase [Candidatus Omnitrophota bacterium]